MFKKFKDFISEQRSGSGPLLPFGAQMRTRGGRGHNPFPDTVGPHARVSSQYNTMRSGRVDPRTQARRDEIAQGKTRQEISNTSKEANKLLATQKIANINARINRLQKEIDAKMRTDVIPSQTPSAYRPGFRQQKMTKQEKQEARTSEENRNAFLRMAYGGHPTAK